MPTFKSLYRKRANTLYSCRRIALRASDTTLILVVPYPQKPKRTCLASMFCGFREFRTRRRSKRDEPERCAAREIDRRPTRMEAGATKTAGLALFFYRLLRDQCELA